MCLINQTTVSIPEITGYVVRWTTGHPLSKDYYSIFHNIHIPQRIGEPQVAINHETGEVPPDNQYDVFSGWHVFEYLVDAISYGRHISTNYLGINYKVLRVRLEDVFSKGTQKFNGDKEALCYRGVKLTLLEEIS